MKLPLNSIDKDILKLLDRERSGLDILDALKAEGTRYRFLGFGRLYPALNRLERRGFITWRWEETPSVGDCRRKFYRRTKKFDEWNTEEP